MPRVGLEHGENRHGPLMAYIVKSAYKQHLAAILHGAGKHVTEDDSRAKWYNKLR